MSARISSHKQRLLADVSSIPHYFSLTYTKRTDRSDTHRRSDYVHFVNRLALPSYTHNMLRIMIYSQT